MHTLLANLSDAHVFVDARAAVTVVEFMPRPYSPDSPRRLSPASIVLTHN